MELTQIVDIAGTAINVAALGFLAWQSWLLRLSVTAQIRINRPRLHVKSIGVHDLKIGCQPYYYLTVANDGPLAAEAQLAIVLHSDNYDRQDREPLRFLVPAHGTVNFGFRANAELEPGRFVRLRADPIRIDVTLGTSDESDAPTIQYEYLHWNGIRPRSVPQFVIAGTQTGWNTNITLAIQNGHHRMTSSAVSLNATASAEKDQTAV